MKIAATVYLIHFAKHYRHARHYVGYTASDSVDARMAQHRNGSGARLMQVVTAAGIEWSVVRTWTFESIDGARKKERQLKKRSATRHCSACAQGERNGQHEFHGE